MIRISPTLPFKYEFNLLNIYKQQWKLRCSFDLILCSWCQHIVNTLNSANSIKKLICVECLVHSQHTFTAMIYPTDFIYYPNQWKYNKNLRNIKISTIGLDVPQNSLKNKVQTQIVSHSNGAASDESIFIRYLNNSTLHGFRYLNDPTIRRTERWVNVTTKLFTHQLQSFSRITWCVLVTLALFGVIYVCYLLQKQFSTNVLATVVETTFFPVFEIPYPAITICNNNRINWQRVPAAIDL